MSNMALSVSCILTSVVILLQLGNFNAFANVSSWRCEAMSKSIESTRMGNRVFKKTNPLVIGHRGNPMIHQENTLAGFKSLLDLNVDGFETDIALTKDKKLILLHDMNTYKMTGENHNVNNMTYQELTKLRIKKQLIYGTKVFNYTKTEKIPLLEDLLHEMKDSGFLMILEMKPSVPPYGLNNSRETGVAVAKMVRRFGLQKQVIVSSFDPFKLYYARRELSELNVCFLVTTSYWKIARFRDQVMADLQNLDGVKDCLTNISKSEFGSFILESTVVARAIGASAIDMDYNIFNNPKYSNDTFGMFKRSYGPAFSYGAWTIYKMALSEQELEASEEAVNDLIKNKAGRLYTDNAPRLLKKLGRRVQKNATIRPSSATVRYVLAFCFVLAFVSDIK